MAMDRDNPNIKGPNPTSTRPGTEGGGNLHFRCADVYSGCAWETSGRTEDEMRPNIEQHGREHHGMKDLGEDVWNRVRGLIRRRAA
jgi:predicted small metal-binding protein